MTFLLLLAALALAGVGGWMRRRQRVLGQTMMVLGGLGLIAVVVLQVRQNIFPSQPKADRSEMAVSFVLAKNLLADVGAQSGQVVLLFPSRSVMEADTEENYENGFLGPLRHGRGKLDLKAVRLDGANQDLSAFKQAMAQNQEAMAVISYAGVPPGFETLFSTNSPQTPFFYVFDGNGTTDWLAALKEGRIKAVVLPRPGVDARGRESLAGMPEIIFDQFYLLATPANADEIAAGLKTDSRAQP